MFGSELIRAMENRGMNRAQFAAEIGATPNAVKKWEEGASFPKPEWWQSIRDVAGINPAEYGSRVCRQTTTQHQHAPTCSPASAINAQSVGSISISSDNGAPAGQGHYELLNELEFEVLTLFRRYGNPTLLQRCLNQLRQAQELFGD